MITIPLSKQGKNAGKYEAIIDDCDADLAQLNWGVGVLRPANIYALRSIYIEGKQKTEFLHRVILSRKLGRPLDNTEQVNHINHDGLDNRRGNLRAATHSQNQRNKRVSTNNAFGLKGVQKSRQKFKAHILINKKNLYLGTFDTPEEAHAAYCAAAKEYFGEFANEG